MRLVELVDVPLEATTYAIIEGPSLPSFTPGVGDTALTIEWKDFLNPEHRIRLKEAWGKNG